MVTLGPVLFFSTLTREAWVLDPADRLALCLARDGESLPARVIDTPDSFSIEWTSTYSFDGDAMVFVDDIGRSNCVLGYPVHEIQRAIQRMRSQ